MAGRFEDLDNILHDWKKDRSVPKSIVEALSRYEKHILEGKRKWLRKNTPALRSQMRLKTRNWSWYAENHRFISNSINKILSLPKPSTTSYGLNSFCYLASKLWNSLPENYRTVSSNKDFERLIRN